ncbi:PP2C family protein-serine/threonine phosphatase [Allostreptomyces psammosilenae]|uniref:PPM-type phosphatase domain-containing protein n=1 Tax=Allostreptomyces psammosilenae TaxID=1892865 RepID=A0A853A4J2_9ACTN|nr:PP2C family protein-serine/threonine phosphatase [Allostreptomyces psammosilenae]NYI08390.1 hypothetical protein [Allostreptomyces psammosilenae]
MEGGLPGGNPTMARWRRSALRAWRRMRRQAVDDFRGDGTDRTALTVLLALLPVLALGTVVSPEWFPPTALVVPVLVGGLALRPSSLVLLYTAASGTLVTEALVMSVWQGGVARVSPGSILVVSAVGCIGALLAQFRARLGVPWRRGESMLIDLRQRLRVQSRVPGLGKGWHHSIELMAAGGQLFSGDFVAAARPLGTRRLEAVVADVSGKGMDAASRALLLSGAFGGLLGSLPRDQFLPAANGYLLRQEWDEGFATAVHFVVDLDTGEYELRSAGHPAALHLSADSGKWAVLQPEGALLGVLDGAEFEAMRGRMEPGDVILLYTDGLVEMPGKDIRDGMDVLTDVCAKLLPTAVETSAAWKGLARTLIETVAKDVNDDRALLVIRRKA